MAIPPWREGSTRRLWGGASTTRSVGPYTPCADHAILSCSRLFSGAYALPVIHCWQGLRNAQIQSKMLLFLMIRHAASRRENRFDTKVVQNRYYRSPSFLTAN